MCTEKIFQRQITKIGLSEAMMAVGRLALADLRLSFCQGTSTDGKSHSCTDSFTHKELRDLFTFDPYTACGTHDLLQCPCETHKRRESETDGDISTILEGGIYEGVETAERGNSRVHKFVDIDSSDSDADVGFVSATQVKPDKYEKAVGPLRASPTALVNRRSMSSTRKEGKKLSLRSGNGLTSTVFAPLPPMKSKMKFWAKCFTFQKHKIKIRGHNPTSRLLQLK
jgi:hypothetical protein